MRYAVLFLLILAAVASAVAQQQPYKLKNFTLGESTLQEFKGQFHHCADNCTDKAVKKYGPARFAPFCSDTENGAAVDSNGRYIQDVPAHTRAGLVYCQPYFPFEQQGTPLFTIADIPAVTKFDFFQDKLYRISATFYASSFTAMQEALGSKYGAPVSTISVEYQNSFGAKFAGHIVSWDNGVSTIILREYGGSSMKFSGLVMEHKALAAQAEEAKPKRTSTDL
jgi:hypothetical protein